MQTTYVYLFLLTIISCTTIHGMKISSQKFSLPEGIELNIEDVWLNIIAQCPAKRNLRETCRYFRDTASVKNEKLFLQNPLIIKQDLLEQYAIYFANLDNYAILCNLLNQGLDPNIVNQNDDNKTSLLRYAIKNNNTDMVKTLLSHPNFITGPADTHKYPLLDSFYLALNLNYLKIAQQIFMADKDTILASRYHTIFSDNHIEIVEYILAFEEKQKKINTLNKILLRAAECNDLQLATFALTHGADINYKERYRGTAIHLAVGYPHMLKLLINHGADVNALSHCQYGKWETPLEQAIAGGNFISIQFLINKGASVATRIGSTPLLIQVIKKWTAERGIPIMELLLNKGVDINEKSPTNDTALSIATSDRKLEVICFLLAYPDIDVNAQNDNNQTPLDIAILACSNCNYNVKEYENITKILIEHGAKTSAELAQTTEHK